MGWLELLAWLRAMQKQNEGPQDDPNSWAHAAQLKAMQAERDRKRREENGW